MERGTSIPGGENRSDGGQAGQKSCLHETKYDRYGQIQFVRGEKERGRARREKKQ